MKIQYGSVAINSNEPDHLSLILFAISRIISYQLSLHLNDKWHKINPDINLMFYSKSYVDSVEAHNAETSLKSSKIDLSLDETFVRQDTPTELSAAIKRKISLEGFNDLLVAVESVDQETEFALPVNNIRKVSPSRIIEVRNSLIDEILKALILISKEINADLDVLEMACESVKSEPWFIEREMGESVVTRGNSRRRAQLIGRWEPDYVYHIARIFDEGQPHKDVLFMVYWRNIGEFLLLNPGRLSWMNRETLKYIPQSRDEYRFAFKVDKGDVDFSYYFEPPQHRATSFYSHISDEIEKEAEETNFIRLNY